MTAKLNPTWNYNKPLQVMAPTECLPSACLPACLASKMPVYHIQDACILYTRLEAPSLF